MDESRSGWRTVRFGNVVRNVDEAVCDPQTCGLERFVGLEHIDPKSLRIKRWGLIADGTSFTRKFTAGQVLFGKRRAYQRKVAVADFDGLCSSDILVFEPADDQLLPELLPFIVQTEGFFQHALGTSAGSLSPRTRWRDLAAYEFPLPPLDEQRRIAEILWAAEEAIVSLSDSLVTATVLYGCLAALIFTDASPNPSAVRPQQGDKITCSLEDIVLDTTPIRYGIVQPGTDTHLGIPTLAIKDMGGDYETGVHRTSPDREQAYVGSRVRAGDVLISVKGTVGRVDVVPDGFEGNISRDIARIRVDDNRVRPWFLAHLLRSPQYQTYTERHMVGTTRKELSIHVLRKLKLILPSVDVQDGALAQIGAVEQGIAAVRAHKEATEATRRALLRVLLPSTEWSVHTCGQ